MTVIKLGTRLHSSPLELRPINHSMTWVPCCTLQMWFLVLVILRFFQGGCREMKGEKMDRKRRGMKEEKKKTRMENLSSGEILTDNLKWNGAFVLISSDLRRLGYMYISRVAPHLLWNDCTLLGFYPNSSSSVSPAEEMLLNYFHLGPCFFSLTFCSNGIQPDYNVSPKHCFQCFQCQIHRVLKNEDFPTRRLSSWEFM